MRKQNYTSIILIFLISIIINPVFAKQAAQKHEQAYIKVAKNWILLLDEYNFGESWEVLSPITKALMKKQQWVIGLIEMRRALGKLKTRKIKQAKYIKSLHGYPDHEGALIIFISNYKEKDSVQEIVGIIHDKDNKWRVVSYLLK